MKAAGSDGRGLSIVARYAVTIGREQHGELLVQNNGMVRAVDHLGRFIGTFERVDRAQQAVHDAWRRGATAAH
jgi:hypothetical protein